MAVSKKEPKPKPRPKPKPIEQKETNTETTDFLKIDDIFNEKNCIKENGKYYYKFFKDNPNFDQNSGMVKQYNRNCMLYFLSKSLLKVYNQVNVPTNLKKVIEQNIVNYNLELNDNQIGNMVNIINEKKNKNLENQNIVTELQDNLKFFLKREHNIIEDANNMYLTPESKKGENIVDRISDIQKVPFCLQRYQADQEICFPNKDNLESPEICNSPVDKSFLGSIPLPTPSPTPSPSPSPSPTPSPSQSLNKELKDDFNTCCSIPKCLNPRLVVGPCKV